MEYFNSVHIMKAPVYCLGGFAGISQLWLLWALSLFFQWSVSSRSWPLHLRLLRGEAALLWDSILRLSILSLFRHLFTFFRVESLVADCSGAVGVWGSNFGDIELNWGGASDSSYVQGAAFLMPSKPNASGILSTCFLTEDSIAVLEDVLPTALCVRVSMNEWTWAIYRLCSPELYSTGRLPYSKMSIKALSTVILIGVLIPFFCSS